MTDSGALSAVRRARAAGPTCSSCHHELMFHSIKSGRGECFAFTTDHHYSPCSCMPATRAGVHHVDLRRSA